jgi:hypothetical protein
MTSSALARERAATAHVRVRAKMRCEVSDCSLLLLSATGTRLSGGWQISPRSARQSKRQTLSAAGANGTRSPQIYLIPRCAVIPTSSVPSNPFPLPGSVTSTDLATGQALQSSSSRPTLPHPLNLPLLSPVAVTKALTYHLIGIRARQLRLGDQHPVAVTSIRRLSVRLVFRARFTLSRFPLSIHCLCSHCALRKRIDSPPACLWPLPHPVLATITILRRAHSSSRPPCHSPRGPPSSPQPLQSAPNPNIRRDAPLCTRPITRPMVITQSAEPRPMRTLRSTGRRDQAGGPPRESRVGGRWRLVWRCTRSSSLVSRSARARAM